jgi:hypothetical protein
MVAKPNRSGPSGRPPLWDRMIYGPLLELPWAQRLPIIRAVKAGVIIVDPGEAPLIARFAHWQTRRFVVLAAVGAVVAAFCAAELLVDGLRFPEFYGIAGIGGSTNWSRHPPHRPVDRGPSPARNVQDLARILVAGLFERGGDPHP